MNNIPIKIYPVNERAETLMNLYPPVLANKSLPEWYKKQESYKRGDINHSSVPSAWGQRQAKKCPAIQEVVTQGIVIPAWSDVYIVKNENYWDWSVSAEVFTSGENKGDISYQNMEQIKGMDLNVIPGYGILKLMSPYSFVTPEGYGLEFQDPFYHIRRDVKMLPGRIETDIWHTVNFVFEFYKDLDKEKKEHIFIKAGEPLLICNVYKKEKNKLDLQLENYNEKHQKIIDTQLITLRSRSESWIDYKENSK